MGAVRRVIVVMSVVPWLAAPVASAQDPKERGVLLGVFGGAITSDTGTGGSAGWMAGWQFTRHFALEGGGWWTREPDIDGFAALFGARYNVLPGWRLTPYIGGGVGLFHAEVDPAQGDLPRFYTDRLEDPLHNTFTDFLIAPSGGVEIRATTHVMLRPEVRVMMASSGDAWRVSALYGMTVAYNFAGRPAPSIVGSR